MSKIKVLYMILDENLSVDSLKQFFTDINIDIAKSEALIASFILGFDSFTEIKTKDIQESILKNNCKQLQDLSKFVRE